MACNSWESAEDCCSLSEVSRVPDDPPLVLVICKTCEGEPEAPRKVYTVLTDSVLLLWSLWIKWDCAKETRAASGKTNFIVGAGRCTLRILCELEKNDWVAHPALHDSVWYNAAELYTLGCKQNNASSAHWSFFFFVQKFHTTINSLDQNSRRPRCAKTEWRTSGC